MSMGEAVFTTCYRRMVLPSLNTPWHLWPIGDVHHDSVNCDRARFREAMATIRSQMTPHDLILYMGDENDKVAASEGAALRMTKLHGGTAEKFDEDAIDDAREFFDAVSWTAPHTLGMIEGNHTWRFLTSNPARDHMQGDTTTAWLARRLKTRWLGYLSYIRVSVACAKSNKRYSVDIVACHGKAGGKLVGTAINQVDDLRAIFPAADIYIMGDNHQRGAWPVSNLFCAGNTRNLTLKQKRQFLCRSGSFLRGFVENRPLYTVRRLLRPAELGHIKIVIQHTRRKLQKADGGAQENGELDIRVEA
jgi:hypothetical protein